MEIILLEKVRNLGSLGEKVKVAPGYGRNFLIPYGKAVPATSENITAFETRRADLEERSEQTLHTAKQRAEDIASLTVTIPAKAGDEGKLYGSVNVREIAVAITQAGVAVQKSEVRLPEGPLRYLGEYSIELQLHTDVIASAKVILVPQQ
jgi:large subunit ribosomal protein L9